jgi:hypothetical protein
VDSDGCAALDAFWDNLPTEIGGLRGLQAAIYDQISHSGMGVMEIVPGPRGTGLSLAQTADPNSFRFVDTAGERFLQQNQGGTWVTMTGDLVHAFAWDGSRDNPYGIPRLSAALTEGLRDWKHQGNLDDILYDVAWPRLKWGFPLEETVKFAMENPGVLVGQGAPDPTTNAARNATPEEWAFQQFAAMAGIMADRRHGDSLGYMMGGLIEPLNGAEGLKSLEGTLQGLLLRLCTSLLQPVTLMNLHVGGTLAYSDTEWRVHAEQLEDLRAFVNSALVWVASQHLMYLGMSCTARVDTEKIQASDALADQQAEQLKIANFFTLFDNGLIADDDLAMTLTGSGVVDAEKLAKRAEPAPVVPAPADPSAIVPAAVPTEPALPQAKPSK